MHSFSLALASEPIDPHPAMVGPFLLMLLAIAAMPFIHQHWWERHYPKVAAGLGMFTVGYYLFFLGQPVRILHVAHEYLSFMALIGSLFVVAGGIHIRVKGEATPAFNVLFLLVGAILANVIGTTGASMLLVRPWIRMNKRRITSFHIVFLIFIVSNVGGSLTPIGDPPLFLGYLKGVPFWWVLANCWKPWLMVVGWLLLLFYLIDRKNFRHEPQEIQVTAQETWGFQGLWNGCFLAVILGAVFLPSPYRELLMVAAAAGSFFTTRKHVYEANHFSFAPIREVAWLFAGLFATMIPALDLLQKHAATLAISEPLHLYWLSGILSGFLDNAPTYLAFLTAAFSLHGLDLDQAAQMQRFIAEQSSTLLAISLGSVFFGALTYLGNGPNFMVKAIAEREKVRTPSFFAYIWRFALPILLPIFTLVALLFFSRFRIF